MEGTPSPRKNVGTSTPFNQHRPQKINVETLLGKKHVLNHQHPKPGPKKIYTTRPMGTIQEHLISESDNFSIYHDLWQRAMLIVAPKGNYSTIYEVPTELLGKLFEEINQFVNFWNIKNYVLMFNNGLYQKSNQFHVKIKVNEGMVNRMRRDHFTRIKMQREYEPANQSGEPSKVPNNPYQDKTTFTTFLGQDPEGIAPPTDAGPVEDGGDLSVMNSIVK